MIEGKRFKKTVENFICENCGNSVEGTGFTNHCPECLWSKHVDLNPGDRENECRGLMEPVDAYLKSDTWFIVQKCKKCGEKEKIKAAVSDSLDSISAIIEKKIKHK